MERAEDIQIMEKARIDERVGVTSDHDFHAHLAMTGHGGAIEGVGGTIAGNLVNSGGTINPGDPGPMDIQGSFTQTAGGMVVLDIDSASIYDTLSISGSASLGGTLELDFRRRFRSAEWRDISPLELGRRRSRRISPRSRSKG